MAGGKLSPRQKMINLMYLIFIAMLAMQMDKKVLSSFGFMKEKIEDANVASSTNIDNILSSLNTKATDQPDKFEGLNKKAQEINKLSEDLFVYMSALKDSILSDTDEEDLTNYEAMSGGDRLDELFFKGEGLTEQGTAFVESINSYRKNLLSILGTDANPDLIRNIKKRFNTDPEPARDENSPEIPWIKSRYEGMPMITSLANMTQIQGDVKSTEAEIYTNLLGGQLESEVSLTNYKGIVALEKTAYFSGENVTGKVVLGRYDATLVPTKVILNGRDATDKVKDGQVMVDIPAGNVGINNIKGMITFMQDGEPVPVPFESSYSVIRLPSEAIISADKMNVVYRGLDNPISISVPGVGENNIKATVKNGNQLNSKGKGKYDLTPGSEDEVEISVSAKISPQKTIKTKKIFRIKTLPAPQGSIRGRFNRISMPSSSLPNITLGANYPDFMYDLKLKVISFKVAVPGEFAVEVNGDRMTPQAKKLLEKARRGDKIDIYDIKAKIIENNYVLEKYCIDITVIVDN
jgi:gliding motility-associated protein GldM